MLSRSRSELVGAGNDLNLKHVGLCVVHDSRVAAVDSFALLVEDVNVAVGLAHEPQEAIKGPDGHQRPEVRIVFSLEDVRVAANVSDAVQGRHRNHANLLEKPDNGDDRQENVDDEECLVNLVAEPPERSHHDQAHDDGSHLAHVEPRLLPSHIEIFPYCSGQCMRVSAQ